MVEVGLLARIEAKPEKADEVKGLLTSALEMANAEAQTAVWFAFQLGPTTFGIFDAFADDAGRQAHLSGPIAQALMSKADELLASPPQIDPLDVLAAKLEK